MLHTASTHSIATTLIDLLQMRAGERPLATAYTWLTDGERPMASLCYAELDRRARIIAGYLQTLRLKRKIALLSYPPGLEFIEALFGCFYAGIIAVPAYVPVSKRDYPRIQGILTDAECDVALTTADCITAVATVLNDAAPHAACVATDRIKGETEWKTPAIDHGDIAYLQYTSGSTASPKGVIISHANVLANMQCIAAQGGFTESSTSVSWLPHFHDMGLIYGFLQPLFSRFPAVLFSPVCFLHRPVRWLNAISHYGATHSGAPNFAYDLCVDRIEAAECQDLNLKSWKVAFNGAEPVHHQTLTGFARRFSQFGFNAGAFYPVYGLAEASLKLTSGDPDSGVRLCIIDGEAIQRNKIRQIARDDPFAKEIVSCGRAGLFHNLVIVDPRTFERCEADTVGEIWASGPSVAAGYWKNESETERVFHGFLSTGEGPYLRTGDLGFLNGAELFVTGRLKDCIIIRGRNYYPQDVEKTVEQSHPAVRKNGTIAFSVDHLGREETVIVSEISRKYRNRPEDIIEAICTSVGEEHEIQLFSVVLIRSGSLPRTSSGKVQRQLCRVKFLAGALAKVAEKKREWVPATDTQSNLSRDVLAAADVEERRELVQQYLRQALAAVLCSPVTESAHAKSLPALGLDSLAVFLIRKAIEEALGIAVPADTLLTETLDGITSFVLKQLESGAGKANGLVHGKNSTAPSSVPLSFAQEQIWLMQQFAPDSCAYNESIAVLLAGEPDISILSRAINELLSRHEILRTTFVVEAGLPVQRVQPFRPIDLPRVDLDVAGVAESEDQVQSSVSREATQKFRLDEDRPVRFKLFCLDGRKYVLVIVAHHIVCDGTSLGIAIRDLEALYKAYRMGQDSPLPELKFQYTDFARWQRDALRAEQLASQLNYWRKQLNGISVLDLPTDYHRPPQVTDAGASIIERLPQELMLKLKTLSRREGATLFMSTLAAFQLLLGRCAGQEDVATGTALTNRTVPGTEDLIGLFVNTVVLRTALHRNLTFTDLLKQVKRTTVEAFEHADVPFIKLVQELVPDRDPSRTPLFQTLLVFQPPVNGETQHGALSLTFLEVPATVAKFDLTLRLTDSIPAPGVQFEYRTSIFKESSIRRMFSGLKVILQFMTENPEQRIAGLSLLSETELHQILFEWNQTGRELSTECIHQLFEKQSAETPDAVAVSYQDQNVTYAALNRRSNQLARYLRRCGVGPEVRVGISVARDQEMIIALLAILKAGGAYVPLDREYPRQWTEFVIEESDAAVLLVANAIDQGSKKSRARVIPIPDVWDDVLKEDTTNLNITVDCRNLAYVIYTSGSTGKPKGIGIQHGSAVTLLNWCRELFQPEDMEGVLASTSISFDLSIFEIFAPLTSGGRVILAENALELPDLPERQSVTLVNTVPSTIVELLRADCLPSSVSTVNLAGDVLLPRVVEQLYALKHIKRVFNLYGPSEDTTYSTYALCPRQEPSGRVAIGKPIRNTRLYVVDEEMWPVGIGTPGELYIGGAGLARGYLSQPALTAERFLPDPFSQSGGERLYRTGDRVRWRSDGQLDFLGRLDQQVKVRGYRIELGEIEAALKTHPGIRQAVVILSGEGQSKRLAAYVVMNRDETISNGELRQLVRGRLPEYMTPEAWVLLEELPLLPNGKLDRKALPEPANSDSAGKQHGAPLNAMQEILCGIFAEVLERNSVGVEENFFEIGGHSLLATQVISRVRKVFGVELPLRTIFETATVRKLEEKVIEAGPALKPAKPRIGKASRKENLPLSYTQQRLWFLAQIEPGSAAYNMPFAVRLKGQLNHDAVQHSLNEIVRRHEALRTSFPVVEGRPVQQVAPELQPGLEEVDVNGEPEEEIRKRIYAEAARCFDLERGPLLRAQLLRLSDQEHILLGSMHHIVADGWSTTILQREFMQLYDSFVNKKEPQLPELEIQYADYAVWQREWLEGELLADQVGYWRKQLNGAEVLELPSDRRSTGEMKARAAKVAFHLPADLSAELRSLSRKQDVTLFMSLLAVFQVVLSKYTGQTDIAVGTVVSNRGHVELEPLIGCFVNTLVLRTQLDGSPDFTEMLRRDRQVCLQAYQHQDVPFEKLVEELRPERQLSRNPFFKVMLVLQNTPKQMFDLSGLELSNVPVDVAEAKFDLVLTVSETACSLTGELVYRDDIFESETMERLARHFLAGLRGMLSGEGTPVASVGLLCENERRQILVDWNRTARSFSRIRCIHELVEEQAAKTPGATAVIFEASRLSYEELNRKANQLAHFLRRLGIAPDVPVGICAKRSLEMVIGMLAVLKAGGAYIPMDPDYPAERLSYMLQDAQAAVLLTMEQFAHLLPEHARVVFLDRQADFAAAESEQNPTHVTDPENLAYVIYTSGSTGRPKGAMNVHSGLFNRLRWMQDCYQLNADDRVLQKTPFTFDVSVWEFFWPLMTGAQLVLARPDGHRDCDYLVEAVQRFQVTTMHFVPAMLRVWLEHETVGNCFSLKRVISSGEALGIDDAERFRNRFKAAELHNLYGPTEASIDVTSWKCLPENLHSSVPIGRPIANTRIYILDSEMQPVPVGVAGELYIGGMGLARGYWNRPDMTAERFLPDLHYGMGARLYRTGDRARFLSDGNIEFLGRMDHQVKLHGFRIELGEIETALLDHPAVDSAVVTVCPDRHGGQQLVAYMVPGFEHAGPVRRLLRMEREQKFRTMARHELPNGDLVFHMNRGETQFLYEEIFADQGYMKHGIRLAPGACVFDVGANIGLFALFAARETRELNIYAFEPAPAVCEVLRANVELHAVNATVFNYALGRAEATVEFRYFPNSTILSSHDDASAPLQTVKAFMEAQGNTGEDSGELDALLQERLRFEVIPVRIRRLSEVIAQEAVNRIDLLKIDVEGSEWEVLEGLQENDWQKIQQIVVEVHDIDDRLMQVRARLEGHGFKVTVEQSGALQRTTLYTLYATRIPGDGEVIPGRQPDSEALVNHWGSEKALVAALRRYLQQKLPEYMVPAAFVLMDELPTNLSGKIDRKALQLVNGPEVAAYVPPCNLEEEILVSLWSSVLKRKQVGVHEHFFELGGHSLLATQLISRIRSAFGVELPIRIIFEAPTIFKLAERVRAARASSRAVTPKIEKVDRDIPLALSYAQQRLWFMDQLEPGSTAYNVPFGLRIKGVLDKRIMRRTVNEIVRRHEALRTKFLARDGIPVQHICVNLELGIEQVDLSSLSGEEREAEAKKRARLEATTPFSLSDGPLLRLTLLQLSESDHVLLVNMHHIISDAWSVRNMVREFAALYAHFKLGRECTVPKLNIQYADFAAWQRRFLEGGILETGLEYWRKRLQGAESSGLPVDFAPAAGSRHPCASVTRELSERFTQRLHQLSIQEGVSLFMTLLASFQIVIGVFAGSEDVVVGTDIANRNQGETEELIGFFANQLALRTDLSGEPDFRHLLRRVRANLLEDYEYQDIPFDKVAEVVSPGARSSMTPLFSAKLVLQNVPEEKLSLPELQLEFVEIEQDTAKFDLLMTFVETSGVLKAVTEYRSDLLSANTIEFLWSQITETLAIVCEQPEISLNRLREQLNAAQTSYRIRQKAELKQAAATRLSPMARKQASLTQTQMSERPTEPHAN